MCRISPEKIYKSRQMFLQKSDPDPGFSMGWSSKNLTLKSLDTSIPINHWTVFPILPAPVATTDSHSGRHLLGLFHSRHVQLAKPLPLDPQPRGEAKNGWRKRLKEWQKTATTISNPKKHPLVWCIYLHFLVDFYGFHAGKYTIHQWIRNGNEKKGAHQTAV